MNSDFCRVVVEKNLESVVELKHHFNERIPNMTHIDSTMKNSTQFICQQDTTERCVLLANKLCRILHCGIDMSHIGDPFIEKIFQFHNAF
jgi:hypothetical protein